MCVLRGSVESLGGPKCKESRVVISLTFRSQGKSFPIPLGVFRLAL